MFASMAEGIREGDPKLPIATCNLTVGPSHDYAKSVTCLEGLEKLYDILTLHTYAQLEGWPTWKRSFPEDPKLKEYLSDVEKLCQWRDGHAKGKPVWITEFGYDSSTKVPVKEDEFKKWEGCNDLQQAQWLVRSFLIFSSMPVERAYLYFFNDNDEPKLHASAGLTRGFVPKPSYYAVSHLYRSLGDFRFSRIVKSEKDLRIQEYQNGTDPKKVIWVAWSPTGEGLEKDMILEGLPGKISRAERMPVEKMEPFATRRAIFHETEEGRVEIQISESPVYLFF
jgi:serine/threonine-protein kinase ATR